MCLKDVPLADLDDALHVIDVKVLVMFGDNQGAKAAWIEWKRDYFEQNWMGTGLERNATFAR